MTFLTKSLRLRLSVLILVPLILVSMIAVYWRYDTARDTAEDIFDKNLMMLTLAVSRDVASSGGDSLSETTANLFRQASGGAVFYHVYGPDGSFVTGYSSPPVRGRSVEMTQNTPFLFDAWHQGVPVRAASLIERVEIDGIVGTSVVTVWQKLEPRIALATNLATQAAVLALVLVATVAGLVIFGVRLGLRPLNQLEAAIQKRSTSDLSPIERQIPTEARGIVERLNSLFGHLTNARLAQERLISNAAHQLRNPIAAIHTMAQATHAAKSLDDSKARSAELIAQTRQTVRLTQQMLSLERIKGDTPNLVRHDVNAFIRDVAESVGADILKKNCAFELSLSEHIAISFVDPGMLREAITNLINNALMHAGPLLSQIHLKTVVAAGYVHIIVENDGALIDHKTPDELFERFKQGSESSGFGLGLAIVEEVARIHGGHAALATAPSTQFSIVLPLLASELPVTSSGLSQF